MDAAVAIFLIFPLAAAFVGLLFIRLYFKHKQLLCALTGFAWILYSGYEYLMYSRVLCTGECNIRVDLLLIYPVLLILSSLSLVRYFLRKRRVRIENKP